MRLSAARPTLGWSCLPTSVRTIRSAKGAARSVSRIGVTYEQRAQYLHLQPRPFTSSGIGGCSRYGRDRRHRPWRFSLAVRRSGHHRAVANLVGGDRNRVDKPSLAAVGDLLCGRISRHRQGRTPRLIARFRLRDRRLALPGPWPSSAIGVPAPEGNRLLTVGEAEAALCIWEAMLYFRACTRMHV
jgi:hypothetical protein